MKRIDFIRNIIAGISAMFIATPIIGRETKEIKRHREKVGVVEVTPTRGWAPIGGRAPVRFTDRGISMPQETKVIVGQMVLFDTDELFVCYSIKDGQVLLLPSEIKTICGRSAFKFKGAYRILKAREEVISCTFVVFSNSFSEGGTL